MALKRNIGAMLSSSALAQAISLAALPVLATLYTPSQFGSLAIYLAYIECLQAFMTLRFEWLLPGLRSKRLTRSVTWLAFTTAAGVALLAALALHCLSAQMLQIPQDDSTTFRFVLPAALAFTVLDNVSTARLVQGGQLGWVARARLVRSFTSPASAVVLAYALAGEHPNGLILGALCASIVCAFTLRHGAQRVAPQLARMPRLAELVAAAKHLGRRAAVATTVSSLNVASFNLVPILIVARFDAHGAGLLFLAQRAATAPAGLVSNSMSLSFWAESARLYRESPQELRAKYLQFTFHLAGLGLLVAIAIVCAALGLRVVLADTVWYEATPIIVAFIPMAWGMLTFSGLAHLIVLGRHHYQLFADGMRLFLIVTSIYASWHFSLSLLWTVVLLSLSSLVGHVCLFFAHLRAYREHGA